MTLKHGAAKGALKMARASGKESGSYKVVKVEKPKKPAAKKAKKPTKKAANKLPPKKKQSAPKTPTIRKATTKTQPSK